MNENITQKIHNEHNTRGETYMSWARIINTLQTLILC